MVPRPLEVFLSLGVLHLSTSSLALHSRKGFLLDKCRGGAVYGMSYQEVRDMKSFTSQNSELEQQAVLDSVTGNVTGGACGANLPEDRRVILRLLTHAHHGSTAFSQLIMSSRNVATLCVSDAWQCEGLKLYDENSDISNFDQVELYSKFWDLRKPVLLDKVAETIEKLEGQFKPYQNVPADMIKEGITDYRSVFVLLWRPFCLSDLSNKGWDYELEGEEKRHRQLVRQYKDLVAQGQPVIMINYGDFVFNQEVTIQRLQEFVPCLGVLSASYVPARGKDVFYCNRWKADGSIASYMRGLSAEDYGYDVKAGSCPSDMTTESHKELLELSRIPGHVKLA